MNKLRKLVSIPVTTLYLGLRYIGVYPCLSVAIFFAVLWLQTVSYPHEQGKAKTALAPPLRAVNNDQMVIPGRVQNGVVILENGPALPEGAAVTITFPAIAPAKPASAKRRIEVPLVKTGKPGTLALTNARIAEILDQEDAAPRH